MSITKSYCFYLLYLCTYYLCTCYICLLPSVAATLEATILAQAAIISGWDSSKCLLTGAPYIDSSPHTKHWPHCGQSYPAEMKILLQCIPLPFLILWSFQGFHITLGINRKLPNMPQASMIWTVWFSVVVRPAVPSPQQKTPATGPLLTLLPLLGTCPLTFHLINSSSSCRLQLSHLSL